jgi:serine phosphatase RsbU (regulator of sigma subunit)
MEISLEPGHVIGPPPVAVAACSVPSDREGGASGDWHDVIALPSGDVAVVVGDAAGHGVQARPLKDALQRGLRGMAMTGTEPCELVNGLDSVVVPDRDGYATVVYAVVEPKRGEVVLTNAGHPPPLLVGRGGSARFLTGTLDPPLGAPRAATSPEVGRTQLRSGDTLVLYTDGLIERRSRDIGAGLAGLAALAARFAGASLDELCARLLCMGLDGSEDASDRTDDLTVIALRLQYDPSTAPPLGPTPLVPAPIVSAPLAITGLWPHRG